MTHSFMSSTYVTATTTKPWSTVVRVESTWANGLRTFGSGVVVGVNDVMTASHMVYSSERGLAVNVTVTPSRDGSSTPFGTYTADYMNYFPISTWGGMISRSEASEDIAVLGFSETLADATGYMRVDPNFQSGQANVTGYPGVYGGDRMVADDGYVYAQFGGTLQTSGLDIHSGNSGGPIWQMEGNGAHVYGVVSTDSWAADTGANYQTIRDWLKGNDSFMPTALPTVSGTAANDVFAYENGGTVPLSYRGQRIEGGAGFDIVTYRHSRDECNVSSYDWGWLAEDIIPGIQAVDHLIDVERLQFSDGTLVIDTDDPAAQVYRLYNATLGRTPDSGGLKAHSENYIAQNWTLSQVAEGFIASTEFQNIYGPVDDGQFVTLLYRNVLGREPEPAGYENWVGAMRSGMGRTDVVVQFSESLEHIGLYSATVPDGFWMA